MMTDFDVVLERLVVDPAFAAALRANPVQALAGYRLDADEMELLHTQVGGDGIGQRTVETRANQSSLFGMLSPLAGLAGTLPGLAGLGDQAMGRALPAEGAGGGAPVEGFGHRGGDAGAPAPVQGFGARGAVDPVPAEGFGQADPAGAGLGAGAVAGIGQAVPGSGGGLTSAVSGGLAGAGETGLGGAVGQSSAGPALPDGYRTKVDVDGDGVWDRHSLHARADGGVDIVVDMNRDGRADFVGHDLDGDGLVEVSEYDRDRDGFFEKRMYDDDGDGWMDRTVRVDPPQT